VLAPLTLLAAASRASAQEEPTPPSIGLDKKEMSIDQDIQYSWPSGWYLTYGPTITADWTASSSDRWTVPVGAGVGKALEIGELALNLQVEAYDNVVRPAGTSTWSRILTVQFVFPETAIRRW
jgi:hypothetical protein